MKRLKKILIFLPLIAVFAFAGCMTPQVEMRLEYDKMTLAMTDPADKSAEYAAPAANEKVKEILDFIYKAAHDTKAMVEGFAGMTETQIKAVNPAFMLMQSLPKDGQSQSLFTDYPYYVKDVKINVLTLGFLVTKISDTHNTADAHFMLTVSGVATDADGNILKDANKKDITYSATVMLLGNPLAPIGINLHWYKMSADSDDIPVYNLIYDYQKTGGDWKITAIADAPDKIVTMEELLAMYK